MTAIHCNSALESDSLDIDNYLPIKSSEEAQLFCENNDGLLEQRKKALQRRIYAACDIANMTNFVASVADMLFSETYQITHRWPTKQYVLICLL